MFLTYFLVHCKFLLYQSGTIVCLFIVALKHKCALCFVMLIEKQKLYFPTLPIRTTMITVSVLVTNKIICQKKRPTWVGTSFKIQWSRRCQSRPPTLLLSPCDWKVCCCAVLSCTDFTDGKQSHHTFVLLTQ